VETGDLLDVGEVLGAYGVAGAVWVRPLTDARGRARDLADVFLVRDDVPTPMRVKSVREVEDRWLVSFEGIETREAAGQLGGARLAVPPSSSPSLPAGAWYVHDLVGREVHAEDGRVLGELTDVIRTGANDCWEIRGPGGDLLFPALKGLVLAVPPGERTITVRVPPGLLEACLTRRKPA
jgi:16S rRNA processing protein RimM